MTRALVNQWQQKAVNVAQLCRVLEISRSGYYAAKAVSRSRGACLETTYLKAAFMASGKSYGSRRLVMALRNNGLSLGRFKVRRLMRQAQLRPIWKPKFVCTTNSKHGLPVAKNILNRQFNPAGPNLAWTSDITYSTPSQRSPPARG